MTDSVTEAVPHVLHGPRVCGGETEKMDWAGACTVRLDDGSMFGVRCSSPPLLSVVERALAGRLVAADEVPAFYSLRLGEPSRRTKHPLHYLYHGGRAVLATRDVGRLLEALMRRIGGLIRSVDDTAGLLLSASALITPDGRAFLVPSNIELVPKAVEMLLTAKGYALADVSQVEIDSAGFDLVLQRPDLGIDWTALEPAHLTGVGTTPTEPTFPYGRHRLAGWVITVPEEQTGPLRPAMAIAHGARLVAAPFREGAAKVLDDLNRVARAVPVTGVSYAGTDVLIDQILAAV